MLVQTYVSIMMKLLTWNIRGIANAPSLRRLKRIIKSNKIICFSIFEPKVTLDSIKDYEFKLNFINSFSNNEGNIWVFWKNEAKYSIISSTS